MPTGFRDAICDDILSPLYVYWRSRMPGENLPGRADIDPVDMPRAALPHIVLAEVGDDGNTIRYRLVGTIIVDEWGSDFTGKYIEEIMDGSYVQFVRGLFIDVVTHRCAVLSESAFRWDIGKVTGARRLYPNDPDFAWIDSEEDFEAAWKLYYNERYAAALEKFQALAAVRETSARSRGIAWSLAALDRKKEGIAAMGKAVSMNPTNADLYEELARLQRFYPDLRAAARRNLNIALALRPYSPKFLLARARMKLADGQMKSAKRDLDNALFFGRYDDAVHDGLRKYHLALDDADAAVEEARKMVALVPKNLKNYLALGMTLFQSEDCRAGEVLRKYLDACRWSKDCTNDDMDPARLTIQMLGFSCG